MGPIPCHRAFKRSMTTYLAYIHIYTYTRMCVSFAVLAIELGGLILSVKHTVTEL